MKRPNLVWIIALALGWLFDFLFWNHEPGLNFALYVLLCLGGGFLALLWNGIRPSWKTLLLLVPILFFAAMNAIRREPMSVFLTLVIPLTLLGVLTVTYLGGRWLKYSLADYVANAFKLAGSMLARPFIFLAEQKKQAEAQPQEMGAGRGQGWKRTWSVLRGLLIALPIVAIFAGLLSSADLVFAARLDEFIELFRLERLPEYLFRAIYILAAGYALAGAILHAGQKSRDEKLTGEDKPLVAPFLGFTESVIVLGAVNLLFAIFVFIQFQYFFGGETNISVENYTYAEYARKGFGELVAVAFFSLLLFLGLSGIVKRQNALQRRVFSGLGVLLVALVGVMLLSAFQRLVLYESAYGFSRLRTYTHVFMIWLGALLALVVLLDLLGRTRAVALTMALAALGFAASLTLLNVDRFIVERNIQRATQGEDLDVAYLASLSSDSVPALADALQDESLPAGTRDMVGAALACRAYQDGRREPDDNWRAFTFSRLWAGDAIQAVEGILNNYAIIYEDDWRLQVETPLGETYDCWTSFSD